MPVPDFSPGEVLTASAMDSIGLWRVGGGALSGSTTQFVNCFTNAFDNYRIIIHGVQLSATADIYFNFLNNTTPANTADYTFAVVGLNALGATSNANSAASTIGYTGISQNGANNVPIGNSSMDIYLPQIATTRSFVNFQAVSFATQWLSRIGQSHYNVVAGYNGIQFTTAGAPTMGGTVSIYGYRKA